MKLYIKRDTSDLLARFSVLDEQCKEKYLVLGSRSPSGEKLVITDTQGEKLLKIKKIPLPVLHAFSIGNKEENFKLIVNLSAKSSTCYYYGISWRIRGDISTGSYDIIDADGTVVASHIKRFSACGDGFELNVNKENRELFCLATAVCLCTFAAVENLAPQGV